MNHIWTCMLRRLSIRVRAFSYAASLLALGVLVPLQAHASCSAPNNAIEAENCQPGTPSTTWDIPSADAGDPTIQGFTTNISVNVGDTVVFKVSTPASSWHLDIYRMGYYGGDGARLITTIQPSASLPQAQPACLSDATTGLLDCGNWAVSATWTVPANATSGIYFAKATRDDTGGASHIVFIVRNDASTSDILFQASDSSWQAYNDYSGNFYGCAQGLFNSSCRSYKTSYNQPFHTRSFEPETWVFGEEYPMVKWLEANGYDVSYFTDTDTDRHGSLLLNHKIYLSNGHDEYWSGGQRASVEAARAAGVHLAFFSSNAMYWKTRWENSIDGTGTPYRTLVCYKETWANAPIDPLPTVSTGTWRDPRFSPPKDGGRPENAVIGTLTRIAGGYYGPATVPQADGQMRFWRNTAVAGLSPGQTYTLPAGTLGEEIMDDEDNGFRPPGLFHLSTTITDPTNTNYLLDYGTLVTTGSSVGTGTMTHAFTLYRHPSGALVFSAGTYDWSWGLDQDHDLSGLGGNADVNMQQATVNLFADMGVQPATLVTGPQNRDGIGGMSAAAQSTDVTPPKSVITAPAPTTSLAVGSPFTVTGTATDSGGVVAAVEVSTDGGATWHPASGRANWTYVWMPTVAGGVTLLSRAVDDSGNIETPSAGVAMTVSGTSHWSLWPLTGGPGTVMTGMPGVQDSGPDSSSELGLYFYSDTAGYISGIRFFKSPGNTGTHTGSLWSNTGTLLATATFAGESTSGWQQVSFTNPVAITANTVYVASYHSPAGHYSADQYYFVQNGVDHAPLHALGSGTASVNGVYAYGAATTFPNAYYLSANYWVDPVFTTTLPLGPALKSIALTPAAPTIITGATQQFTATGTYADGSTQNLSSQAAWSSSNAAVATVSTSGLAAAVSPGSTNISAALNGITGLTALTVTAGPLSVTTSSLPGATQGVAYAATLAARGGTPAYTWKVSAGALPAGITLSAAGVLSGTPTATGTFTFSVQASDSSTPTKQTATAALSLVVSVPLASIWPATAVPAVADIGADSAVELGVKFTSDVNGYVYGIRFYKSAANTGAHIGNLWSSTGALLASVTFANETASGWQQANFASPVLIAANTVYVASYHSTIGHYSATSSYFAVAGFDSPPLHALAQGASGNDGVYAYGAASTFPTNGYNATNYWTDVAFNPIPTAPLAVTTAALAAAVQGTAYSATLAASGGISPYTWSITSGALPAGLTLAPATGVISGTPTAAGTSSFTVQATDSSSPGKLTATAALSIVVAPSLAITTTTLAGGTQSIAYSATLAATGGTGPYTWAISSGTLPAGLSLAAATGIISGTPTAAGTSSFTVQATDSGSPTKQTATAALSIVVATPLRVTTASLPAAAQSVAYTGTLTASGGTSPYTWSISSGTLPAGLSLAPASGVISGTPTTAGTSSFTVQATDSGSPTKNTATAALSIVVATTGGFTIWPSTTVPTRVDAGADNPVELGVKFTASSAGHVAGVRFYKASTNTGTHTAHLWSSAGALLASATFSGETASGWQQVNFATPVGISAGAVYIVSYHTMVGHYSVDQNFFANGGVSNGPLTALSNGTSGVNGVYAYGSNSSFPSNGYLSSNYWVDVAFTVP